ncbi:MAG: hypothetical protein J6Y28_01480 [Acholeplasmatales bacterium]|nr:hypothetical protein [Acholeplasmatales bacterium]
MEKWYFTKTTSPKNIGVDKYADSKFGLDKWNSFTREIIQNSLDARDDSGNPVKVSFDITEISLDQMPGGDYIKKVVDACLSMNNINHQTRAMYQNAQKILDQLTIQLLKISDENTNGTASGIDDGWGALVYDEGVSKKNRPGSAGSHGVGKKVPFMISGINTVFYSTKNDIESLFEGKTSFVNFDIDGETYDPEGWYGEVNDDETDRRKKVEPIIITDDTNIDDFFLRRDKKGTDVIIAGVEINDQLEESKKKIINSILENFFVAILEEKLVCNVFGEEVNKANFSIIMSKYYQTNKKNFSKIDEYKNVFNGNLRDYYRVYCEEPMKFPLEYEGITYGYVNLFFDKGNEKNKKYYCIVREHGMKIQDRQISNAETAFSGVALITDVNSPEIEEKERINGLLAARENAAHDDFVIEDEKIPCEERTKVLIESMYRQIEEYIISQTVINVSDETPLEGLDDMISMPSILSKATLNRGSVVKKKNKKKTSKRGSAQRAKNYDDGTGGSGDGDKKHKDKGHRNPAKEGDTFEANLLKNYTMEPVFFKVENKYVLKFAASENVKSAKIRVQAFSVDGKVTFVNNLIKSATKNGKKMKVNGYFIEKVKINKDEINVLEIEIKDGLDYSLDCDISADVKKVEQDA